MDAQYFKKRLEEGLRGLNVSSNDIGKRMEQFYFPTANMASVSDKGANFLPYLLGHWTSPRRQVLFNDSGALLLHLSWSLGTKGAVHCNVQE